MKILMWKSFMELYEDSFVISFRLYYYSIVKILDFFGDFKDKNCNL